MSLKSNRYFILALSILMGCAQPRYVQETAAPELKANQGEVADCSIKWSHSGLCLFWRWEKLPTGKQPGVLVFKSFRLSQLDNSPIESDLPGSASVVLWMPEMGHGSALTTTEKIDTGTYRSSNVFFLMPGKWEIKFDVKENDIITESASVAITI